MFTLVAISVSGNLIHTVRESASYIHPLADSCNALPVAC